MNLKGKVSGLALILLLIVTLHFSCLVISRFSSSRAREAVDLYHHACARVDVHSGTQKAGRTDAGECHEAGTSWIS